MSALREPRDSSNYHDPEPLLPRERLLYDYAAEARSVIEERAREELLAAAEPFCEWLPECDSRLLAAVIATAHKAIQCDRSDDAWWYARENLSMLMRDYLQHRLALAENGDELADEERRIREAVELPEDEE